MPFYQVFHSVDLSPSQKDSLAQIITDAHTAATGALRLFVNVEFYHNTNPFQYIGGLRRPNNKLIGWVRPRGEAGEHLMKEVAREIQEGWDNTVGSAGEKELSALWINDTMLTGVEFGAILPRAFEDQAWFEEHKAEFQERARNGDELFSEAIQGNIINRSP
ncbi:hypothetical protein TWF225_010457 [Orbilia oligospora]|nr:hypothetical protein TWF225_010457 [Orbilia oligospora]KAF3237096.1 hypothetical protein TWF128_001167 [Orbilia oligospora]KAF3267264.1 hypothetical protein TWF217_000341 [Orbilia oligospora]KAF3283598.1 hypothetical protein TWF132_010047 [Orbilia oligospora]